MILFLLFICFSFRLRSLRRPVPLEDFTFHDSISLLVEDILVPQIVYEAEFRILIDHPERAEALDIGVCVCVCVRVCVCACVCVFVCVGVCMCV